ncbi:MAG: alpha/beta hydrolase [Proteobacteria bacterium]|nr:alpha/beta hydrolase [Pseudomonadota bacterium]
MKSRMYLKVQFAKLGVMATLTVVGAMSLGLSGCQTAMMAKVATPTWTIPPGVATQTVNGYPMSYTSRGSGPTIVFLHGVLGDYRYWQQPLETWTADFRVIALSMRHFYPEKWDGKGEDFTVAQHAKDIAAFIEWIGGPVYLVGWSYGGRPAYEVARARPDLIKKLVLIEGGPDMRPRPPGVPPDTDVTERSLKVVKYFDAGDIDGGLAFGVDDINGPGRWASLPKTYHETLRENAWTLVGIGRGEPYTGTCSEFGALRMPVLLVKGELTTPRLRDIVLEESKCLPQATVVTIPKAGHSSAAGNPPAFKLAVYSFLQK